MCRSLADRVLLFTLAAAALVRAQPPNPSTTFDAASIKENKDIAEGGMMRLMPGGGLSAQHLSAHNYLTIAFQLQQFQVIGAPGWLSDSYYDIQAKPATAATREQTLVMLQALLRERFHLTSHREQRQLEGYSLVIARANQLGPNLQRSAIDCGTMFATAPRCRTGAITSGSMKVVGVPLYQLIQVITNQVRAPVVDDTQLTGPFNIELRWSAEVAPTDDAPSIFTALEEQLGLRVERKRVATEMFVVDHVEKPMPD